MTVRGIILLGAALVACCSFVALSFACTDAESTPTVTIGVPTPSLVPTSTVAPTSLPTRPTTHEHTVAPVTATPDESLELESTVVPSPTPLPTEAPSPAATVIERATATPTSAPTATAVPSATPTPSPIPEPTALTQQALFIDNDDCDSLSLTEPLSTIPITIQYNEVRLEITAELADDPGERGQGLMCRSIIPDGSAMLFVFDSVSTHGFWMYNTYVPLDIVYLDGAKLPVQAVTMSPCPRPEGADDSAWSNACLSAAAGYGATVPVRYALELPAGWLERVGVPLDMINQAEFSW